MPHLPLIFQAPLALAIASAIALAACAIALVRRVRLPRLSIALLLAGLVCLCFAAGKLAWNASPPLRIAVMIDASSSTRTARYHDPAALAARLRELLPRTPYTLYAFADQITPTKLADANREILSDQTDFDPPSADAIVLFSDGQFEFPRSAPPTFAVIDPALERVNDAAVERLETRGRAISVTVNNAAETDRPLTLTNATPATMPAPPGETVIAADLVDTTTDVTATLARSDRWPENDSLTAMVPPPQTLERWWIAEGSLAANPPPGWRVIAPADLPGEGLPYLSAGVIALVNVPSDDLPRIARERLDQHVRETGGGLLILGGDHAFAAGGYAGSALEGLSPLASNPPTPTVHWVLLIDSSGSMATALGNNTRLNFATDAMLRLIPLLPAKDALTIGDFARDVRWWTSSAAVDHIDNAHLVPEELRPTGPTNLQAALQFLAQSEDGTPPTQVLVITDGEAQFDDPAALGRSLQSKSVRVSVLSHQPLAASSPLKQLIVATGGLDIATSDPREWAAQVRQLLRAASPPWMGSSTLHVEFTPTAPQIAPQSASPWNHTWLKPNATELAVGHDQATTVPAVAAWNIGAGAVLSTAFTPSPAVADALAEVVAIPPRDPRFTVTWTTGPRPRVTIDAREGERFLNDLRPRLAFSSDQANVDASRPFVQTAPGRYELSFVAPTRSVLARLLLDNKVIDSAVLAGRYPREFDAIGNDRATLRALAAQTGGEMIEPGRTAPIQFPDRPGKTVALTTPLTVLAALFIAAGLVWWKLR